MRIEAYRGQLPKWPTAAAKAAACAYTEETFNPRPMETLDLATLELLAALEADLEVPDFDADDLLDDEA